MIISFTGILCLLGLTWVFAIFTFITFNDVVYTITQVLFTIFNASQGFFIFLFFVVLSSDSREAWLSLAKRIFKVKEKEPVTSKFNLSSTDKTTSKANLSSSNVYDSEVGTMEYSMAKSRKFSLGDLVEINAVALEEQEGEEELPDILQLKQAADEEERAYKEQQEMMVSQFKRGQIIRRSTAKHKHHEEIAKIEFVNDESDDEETTL